MSEHERQKQIPPTETRGRGVMVASLIFTQAGEGSNPSDLIQH